MSYQKVWNNDSGDLSTLLPFSIIWVNCNPPFCLWISIFFSTSLFLFFSNQFYTLWKVPPRFAERIVSIPCILYKILASASNETVLCSKQFTNQKERPEKMKLNQTLTPTVRVSCPGPLGQSVSQVYNSVLTARWSQYDAHLFICSSLYFVQFTSKYSSSDWNEKKYLRDYTIIYVWCVQAFSELILGDIPV